MENEGEFKGLSEIIPLHQELADKLVELGKLTKNHLRYYSNICKKDSIIDDDGNTVYVCDCDYNPSSLDAKFNNILMIHTHIDEYIDYTNQLIRMNYI